MVVSERMVRTQQEPMANKARRDGTDAETKVKRYAISRGYRYAKLLRQEGAVDKGDVHLGDGYPVCMEVKGGQKAVTQIGTHVREMIVETANSKSETGVVIAKKARSADVGEWYAVMPVAMWFDLVERLYPPPQRRRVRIITSRTG